MIRLMLVAVWFGLAIVVFVGPGVGRFGPMAGWLALVLGGYNLARWWADRRPSEVSIRGRIVQRETSDEPNPDFKFDQ